jgi:hypothetical protein
LKEHGVPFAHAAALFASSPPLSRDHER